MKPKAKINNHRLWKWGKSSDDVSVRRLRIMYSFSDMLQCDILNPIESSRMSKTPR